MPAESGVLFIEPAVMLRNSTRESPPEVSSQTNLAKHSQDGDYRSKPLSSHRAYFAGAVKVKPDTNTRTTPAPGLPPAQVIRTLAAED